MFPPPDMSYSSSPSIPAKLHFLISEPPVPDPEFPELIPGHNAPESPVHQSLFQYPNSLFQPSNHFLSFQNLNPLSFLSWSVRQFLSFLCFFRPLFLWLRWPLLKFLRFRRPQLRLLWLCWGLGPSYFCSAGLGYSSCAGLCPCVHVSFNSCVHNGLSSWVSTGLSGPEPSSPWQNPEPTS